MKEQNIIKKILIFMLIVIIPNFIIYTYPMHKIKQMSLNEEDIYTLGQSKILNSYTSILTSNIADKYKQDAVVILGGYKDSLVYQRNASLKSMGYLASILIILLIISTIVAFKKYVINDKGLKDKKRGKRYIAYAFLMALVLAIILFLILIFNMQYMFIAK